MQIASNGTPIITSNEEHQKADRFVDKLVGRVYDRLPRVVRLFISRDKLADYLRSAIVGLASEL